MLSQFLFSSNLSNLSIRCLHSLLPLIVVIHCYSSWSSFVASSPLFLVLEVQICALSSLTYFSICPTLLYSNPSQVTLSYFLPLAYFNLWLLRRQSMSSMRVYNFEGIKGLKMNSYTNFHLANNLYKFIYHLKLPSLRLSTYSLIIMHAFLHI